jgi:hypothetical protein
MTTFIANAENELSFDALIGLPFALDSTSLELSRQTITVNNDQAI